MRAGMTHVSPREAVLAGLLLLTAGGAPRAMAQDPEAEDAVRRARTTLALEIGAEESALREEGVSFVSFPSAALGCPRPDEMAASVVTPGWRVVLRLGEKRYDVRVASTGGRPASAARPGPRPSLGPRPRSRAT